MQPRKATVSIIYQGTDITKSIASDLSSFSFDEAASGEGDSISVELKNDHKRWIGGWMPQKTDKIKATIQGWDGRLHCGEFTVDDFSASGAAQVCSIGAISTPADTDFKSRKQSKTWESVTLQEIASEKAGNAGLSLIYEAGVIQIQAVEQSEQNDCEFLFSLCREYGLAMKVYANKIVIFDEAEYESRPAIARIHESDMSSWSYNTTLTGTYTGGIIQYTDPLTNQDCSATVGEGPRFLEINEKADSKEDADKKARAAVNEANKNAETMSVTMMGRTDLFAGGNVEIMGLEKLDGKYAIDKLTYSLGDGFTVQMELRKIQPRL